MTFKNQSGYTLIEVIIVVAIIGILASLAIINFRSTNQSVFVEVASREISSALSSAQQSASSQKLIEFSDGVKRVPDSFQVVFRESNERWSYQTFGCRYDVVTCENAGPKFSLSVEVQLDLSNGDFIEFLAPEGKLSDLTNPNSKSSLEISSKSRPSIAKRIQVSEIGKINVE